MTAIYKRELRSYFHSMIGYVFIAVVAAFTGIYFMATNLFGGYPYFSYTLTHLSFITLLTVPILTMKSMAEERHSKTDQMLLTYPVNIIGMVMGKYLAMMTIFSIPLLLSCLCPLIISASGTGYPITDYATILAYFFFGCLLTAVGMFISSLTESQIIAAVGTFGALLLLYLWPNLISFLPTSPSLTALGLLIILTAVVLMIYGMSKNTLLAMIIEGIGIAAVAGIYFFAKEKLESLLPKVLGALSCTGALDNFGLYNVFDLGGLFFYLSGAALFVFLTVQAVQKRRWN